MPETDRRSEHEDRILSALDKWGESLGERIESLKEGLRDHKADTIKRLDDQEARLRSVEKEQTSQMARMAMLAGLVSVVGAGLVEALVSLFAKK
jgi:uncharacterized protein YlxW (UPF0749 family)